MARIKPLLKMYLSVVMTFSWSGVSLFKLLIYQFIFLEIEATINSLGNVTKENNCTSEQGWNFI